VWGSASGRGPDTGHKAVSGSDPRNHATFISSVAELLRGDYKRSEYGKVILPLTVLRSLDGILATTKHSVLEEHEQLQGRLSNVGSVLTGITGVQFWNTSELDLRKVLDDPPNVADQLRQYVVDFSEDVPDIFEKFDLDAQIARLDASNTERCPGTLDSLERWDLWRSSYFPAPFLGYRTEASTGLIDPACIV
jgi:hypothetical protein